MRKQPIGYMRYIIIAIIVTIAIFPAGASAQVDEQIKNDCAQTLAKLKVMQGDTKGNLQLDRPVTRTEFVTLVIRLMGWDRDTDIDSIGLAFSDASAIQDWATDYIKIALKHGLIIGYNAGDSMELRPNRDVTTAEAMTILIRALGYESTVEGEWPDGVMNKASSLGLDLNFDLPAEHRLTRGETAVIIYNALTVAFYR
jgi:hypothetical protein